MPALLTAMVKQVPKSDKIQRLVAQVTGDDTMNLDDLAVYEAVFISTLPLKRLSGIYQAAVTGADVLAAAKAKLDAGETVPLAIMHNSASLPKGRVLSAELRAGVNGSTQLQGLFYLPRKDTELVNKIDTGVINEVSINFMPQQLLCSECSWDYMAEDASFENIWECTCANGHKIGAGNTHVRVHGLKAWNELSLVGRGASQGATILPRSRQSLGAPDPARLAARGFDDRILALCASVSDSLDATKPTPENVPMTTEVELKANLIVAERDLVASKAIVTAKDAEITALTAKLAESTAQIATLSALDAAKLKVDHDAAVALVDEIATATLAALGRSTEKLPEIVSDRVKLVRDLRAKLAVAIPAGGAASAAGTPTNTETPKASHAAFKRS